MHRRRANPVCCLQAPLPERQLLPVAHLLHKWCSPMRSSLRQTAVGKLPGPDAADGSCQLHAPTRLGRRSKSCVSLFDTAHKIRAAKSKQTGDMATLIAAGAASCAGYFIGNLALKPKTSTRSSMTYTRAYAPAPLSVKPGQCALCHTWFQNGDVVSKLYCGHVYHRACTEHIAGQAVHEEFRITCPLCRGLSWVTRFAVTQVNRPIEPSVAPINMPFMQPPLPVATPVPHVHPPPLIQPIAATPAPAPVAVADPVMTSPPPAGFQDHSFILSPPETPARVTNIAPPQLHPSKHKESCTPYLLTAPVTRHCGYPSCSLCTCTDCASGGDGNCQECGRCACYACAYNKCTCRCRCKVQFSKKMRK